MQSGKFFIINRLDSKTDGFNGHFSHNEGTGRYAFSVGNREQPLSDTWSESLVSVFTNFQYPIENSRNLLQKFLTESRELWIGANDWERMKWYIRNKSINGVNADFSGISLIPDHNGMRCSGFSSGFSSCFAIDPDGSVLSDGVRGSHDAREGFWSGYIPPVQKNYCWNFQKSFYFELVPSAGSKVVLVSPTISEWIERDLNRNIRKILNEADPSVMIRNRIKTGEIKNHEAILLTLDL